VPSGAVGIAPLLLIRSESSRYHSFEFKTSERAYCSIIELGQSCRGHVPMESLLYVSLSRSIDIIRTINARTSDREIACINRISYRVSRCTDLRRVGLGFRSALPGSAMLRGSSGGAGECTIGRDANAGQGRTDASYETHRSRAVVCGMRLCSSTMALAQGPNKG